MNTKRKIDRRKYIKMTAVSVAGLGASAWVINYSKMFNTTRALVSIAAQIPSDTKQVFRQCGTCSHTFFYLLNREFGHPKKAEEIASDPLAGGLGSGHQCGMLWGSSLAAGAESYRRYDDRDKAISAAIAATRQIMKSFKTTAGNINCRDVVGFDFSSKFDTLKYMFKIMLQGGPKNSVCFNLAEKWAPLAIKSARDGLSQVQSDSPQKPLSCAAEVVRKMGASDEEMVMVSGFAGGMGLSGNACGALGAAIWLKNLTWCRQNPGETPPYFKNPAKKNTLKAFYQVTGSEVLCNKICQRNFRNLDEHSKFIQDGGCAKLIDALVRS
jgi:hypothetical protein